MVDGCAIQADRGCFDPPRPAPAFPLSMTGVEKLNKVTTLIAGSPMEVTLKAHCARVLSLLYSVPTRKTMNRQSRHQSDGALSQPGHAGAGAFSLRMFHRSWGIMMIRRIFRPCTVLDFPTRADFARELTTNAYDIVGISSIIVNIGKVREMCRLVRKLSPHSVIVVGGTWQLFRRSRR